MEAPFMFDSQCLRQRAKAWVSGPEEAGTACMQFPGGESLGMVKRKAASLHPQPWATSNSSGFCCEVSCGWKVRPLGMARAARRGYCAAGTGNCSARLRRNETERVCAARLRVAIGLPRITEGVVKRARACRRRVHRRLSNSPVPGCRLSPCQPFRGPELRRE